MERTSEEWGRVAVSLPGWRWMGGMQAKDHARPGEHTVSRYDRGRITDEDGVLRCRDMTCGSPGREEIDPHGHHVHGMILDPDDAATAGALIALLGPRAHMHSPNCDSEETDYWEFVIRLPDNHESRVYGDTLGRACIAAAETLGRWPGGAA